MSNSFSAGLLFGPNPVTFTTSGAQHGTGHLVVSALTHWERSLGRVWGDAVPLSQLPRSLQCSMPESQGESHPGAATAETSSHLLWFPQNPPRYSGAGVAGGGPLPPLPLSSPLPASQRQQELSPCPQHTPALKKPCFLSSTTSFPPPVPMGSQSPFLSIEGLLLPGAGGNGGRSGVQLAK